MAFIVHLAHRAEKGLRGIPSADRERIFNALEEMEFDPLAGDIVKLKGMDAFRRRVGSYVSLRRVPPSVSRPFRRFCRDYWRDEEIRSVHKFNNGHNFNGASAQPLMA